MEYEQYNPHNNYINQIPDGSASSEKALIWSNTQYMSESGYSTQAPSISSIDAFLNNEQPPMPQMEPVPLAPPPQLPPIPQQQQQQPINGGDWQNATQMNNSPTMQTQNVQVIQEEQPQQQVNSDNAVANWINYQDNSEMASKAIPDLLKLLLDEDLVVVQQAAILLNQMSRIEGPRMALIQTTNAVQCLVDCLNTTADFETARSLVGALYGVSTQKPSGVQAIINSKALQPLVKMLSAPVDTIISYAITTLHNVLLECGDKVKQQLRKMGTIHQMVPLLNKNDNGKFLSILVDCLQLLAFGNQESKQIILELGGTQILVNLLFNNNLQYQKLLLNTTRLLKVLSVCSQNKTALINLNAVQALTVHLQKQHQAILANQQQLPAGTPPSNTNSQILQNCLITLRNLSDAATRLNGLEQLIQSLLQILSHVNDYTISTLAAGILSNLTCNNENNKKAALRSNGIQILLKLVQVNLAHTGAASSSQMQLIEPCLCALRHITNRHPDMLLAQEQFRSFNGIQLLVQLMSIQPRSWPVIKALLGVVRNLCSNQANAQMLRANCIIEKLMQILYDAYTEIQMRTNQAQCASALNILKVDDVNLFDIVDSSSAALLILAKDYQNQIIMKDLDCIGFFVQMFFSPLFAIQKSASSLLNELSANKECGMVIEQQPGFQQFIQVNFCNQFGQLKSMAELSAQTNNNSNVPVILQNVTTIMQRLQENRRAFIQQQQQQSQPQTQQQMMYYNNMAVYGQQTNIQQQQQQQQQFANHQFY